MLNNQIIITDGNVCARARRNDKGVVDAADLTTLEWEELRSRNTDSTKAKLVKCAKCWELYRSVQWMQTFNRMGTRVVRHQPGEQRPDHDYDPVETPGHVAHVDRALSVWDQEGYPTGREVWTPNRKARNDAVADGPHPTAYECQHSPFSTTSRYSAPERTRHTEEAGYTVLWHTDNRAVRGMVPILRTDGGLPPEVIRNLNYRLEFRGGLYSIEVYTCTVREGHECPNRKFSGCGKPHARGQITAGQLDDVLRGAPVGTYMPVTNANVIRAPKFFWTDRDSYDRYLAYIAGARPLLNGAPTAQTKARSGARRGHSRAKEVELQAMRAQAVLLPRQATALSVETPGRPAVPAASRPTSGPASGICDTGRPLCGQPARFYAAGWRCDRHKPSSRWINT